MSILSEPLNVMVSPEKQKRLDEMAGEFNQSRDWVVNQAIDQYIKWFEWQKERIQQRLDQANHPNALFHSSDDVDAIIESITS